MKKIIVGTSVLFSMMFMGATAAETFVLEKRDTDFSIDGGNGAANGRQIYLWNTDTDNVNQQWEETFIAPNYYQYQKVGTNHCLDGGNGADLRQEVNLWVCSSDNRNQHWEKIEQANGHFRLKKRGESFSIDCNRGAERRQVCYLWRSGDSNVNQHFDFLSVGGDSGGDGDFGLDPNAEPWENFDLSEWRLDTPASRSSSSDDECRTQQTDPEQYGDSDFDREDSEEYFFTHSDGGMRFVTEVGQATTGNNCDSRTRSELREMLRGSDTSISDDGDSGDFRNNWALGYQPQTADADFTWGARGGRMEATLRVNQVTTQGNSSNIGRTVIGQIHASDDEPLRLNYKHREGFQGGCIYASSERNGGDDTDAVLVGDSTSCNNDPGSDGIALDELFSYVIENIGEDIIVTIIRGDRDGEVINSVVIDLNEINGGYDLDDEWNYFKAGAYTQNDAESNARNGDSDIVTFYRLDVTH